MSVVGLVVISALFASVSCNESPQDQSAEVVVYCSLDRPHSKPILDLFEKETGIRVKALYDTEASKTVGLVNRLLEESPHPQADVFWNSEVIRTLVLKEKGVLAAYKSPAAEGIPVQFKDPENYWAGFAARARVFLINTRLTQDAPSSLKELTDSKWRGKFAMANPLFGTAGTQVATWWVNWGPQRTQQFLAELKMNEVVITSGNAEARNMVASGQIPLCLTDTDDALGAISQGHPVKMVWPDQGEDGEGTLLIPNTVALIKNAPHSEQAKRLIDFLLSPAVEKMLMQSTAEQIPLRAEIPASEKIRSFGKLHFTDLDFAQAAKIIPQSSEMIRKNLID